MNLNNNDFLASQNIRKSDFQLESLIDPVKFAKEKILRALVGEVESTDFETGEVKFFDRESLSLRLNDPNDEVAKKILTNTVADAIIEIEQLAKEHILYESTLPKTPTMSEIKNFSDAEIDGLCLGKKLQVAKAIANQCDADWMMQTSQQIYFATFADNKQAGEHLMGTDIMLLNPTNPASVIKRIVPHESGHRVESGLRAGKKINIPVPEFAVSKLRESNDIIYEGRTSEIFCDSYVEGFLKRNFPSDKDLIKQVSDHVKQQKGIYRRETGSSPLIDDFVSDFLLEKDLLLNK